MFSTFLITALITASLCLFASSPRLEERVLESLLCFYQQGKSSWWCCWRHYQWKCITSPRNAGVWPKYLTTFIITADWVLVIVNEMKENLNRPGVSVLLLFDWAGWVVLCTASTACQTSGRERLCLWSVIWWVSTLIYLYFPDCLISPQVHLSAHSRQPHLLEPPFPLGFSADFSCFILSVPFVIYFYLPLCTSCTVKGREVFCHWQLMST